MTTRWSTTTWSPDDLAQRLCRALDLAAEVVRDFGSDGYVDSRVRELSFGPEKVIAEAAMLAYAAAGSCDHPDVMARVEAVARLLVPYSRSPRALADMALQPVRAFKHAVPHVLLTSLGFADEKYDEFFRTRCALALGLAGDLPPSARLERHWVACHWDGVWRPTTDDQLRGTFADSPIDVLSDSREEAYSVTHLLFYLTDFGHEAPPDSVAAAGHRSERGRGLVASPSRPRGLRPVRRAAHELASVESPVESRRRASHSAFTRRSRTRSACSHAGTSTSSISASSTPTRAAVTHGRPPITRPS